MDDDGIKKTDHYLSLEYLWEEVVKKGGRRVSELRCIMYRHHDSIRAT